MSIEEFKNFIEINKDILTDKAITIDELPADDELLNDDCWEDDYKTHENT